jgi:hypothetical protein
VPASDGALILPAELLRRGGLDRSESTTMHKERRQWFLDRQIDPGGWAQVHPILLASSRAQGIPYCALDRAWVRSVGLEEWRRIHQGRQERDGDRSRSSDEVDKDD